MSKFENQPLFYWTERTKDFKRETEKAIKKGIRRGLSEIQKSARKNLKSSVKGATKINPKYNDSLTKGIHMLSPRRNRNNKDEISGKVSIMSNRKKKSGSYRLIFLEGGTVDRKTRKGYNRGILKPKYFFRDAQIPPSTVQSYIDQEMNDALKKLT
jgi:hypothetical protein